MSRNYWTLGKEGMRTRLSKAQAAYEDAVENVSDLHVKISDGNTKLGAIPSLSLIPGHGLRQLCNLCQELLRPSQRLHLKEVIKTRAINSAIYHEDPERYFKEIDGYLDYRFPKHSDSTSVATYRTNGYLDKDVQIARKHKDTKFCVHQDVRCVQRVSR